MANTIDPQTILNDSQEYVDALKSELTDAVDNLESFATDRMTWVDFPARTVFEPEKPARLTADALPDLKPLVFGAEFGDPAAELNTYKGHVFIAPFLNTMQTTLMGWVESGGVGISQAVQDALFGNMRERDLQALNDGLQAVAATDAKKGFAYPTHRRRTSEVIVNYQQTAENRNREITALMADLAQKNVQAAITANINIEQLHSSFSLGLSQIFIQIKNRIIEKFRIEADVRIAEFDAKIKAILAGYNVAEVNGRIDIAYQELRAKKWEVEMREGGQRTQALISQAMDQTKLRLQAAEGYLNGLSTTIQAALLQSNGITVVTAKGYTNAA
jgi:hypothetical protein